jgi:hypothetical protein
MTFSEDTRRKQAAINLERSATEASRSMRLVFDRMRELGLHGVAADVDRARHAFLEAVKRGKAALT